MRKLSIDDLQVESFVTRNEPYARGTVRAHDTYTLDPSCMDTCYYTCPTTCDIDCTGGGSQPNATCERTCPATCPASCPYDYSCNPVECPTPRPC